MGLKGPAVPAASVDPARPADPQRSVGRRVSSLLGGEPVHGAPAFHVFLAVVAAIGLVERTVAALHGDGLGGRWWAIVSALAMLLVLVASIRSFRIARRQERAASA